MGLGETLVSPSSPPMVVVEDGTMVLYLCVRIQLWPHPSERSWVAMETPVHVQPLREGNLLNTSH